MIDYCEDQTLVRALRQMAYDDIKDLDRKIRYFSGKVDKNVFNPSVHASLKSLLVGLKRLRDISIKEYRREYGYAINILG